MPDTTTTIHVLKDAIKKFNQDRKWGTYNTPKNLAMALAVEAAELMEHFTWLTEQESVSLLNDSSKKSDISHEIADMAILLLGLCESADIDLSFAIEEKLALNAVKYPIEGA